MIPDPVTCSSGIRESLSFVTKPYKVNFYYF